MGWLLLFLALLSHLNVSAQTTGFPSLRLSGSARPAGMADLSAALCGPEATNPAALSATTARAYAFSHKAWIGDINQQHLHVFVRCERACCREACEAATEHRDASRSRRWCGISEQRPPQRGKRDGGWKQQ